jgi:Permuted papain-like amidase enzyme, YaeF/YiiX, C92 family
MRESSRCPGTAAALLSLLLLLPGCAYQHGSVSTVPAAYRHGNPWSPAAYAARARGEWQPSPPTPQMLAWAEFARQNIHDGDLIFRDGWPPHISDYLENRLQRGISDSGFTHVALAFHEGDEVWVYDVEVEPLNMRKMPFSYWMLDTIPNTMAIRRLRPPYQHCIPVALAYCEEEWLRQPKYDHALRLDDEKVYCSELIEKAFRKGGLELSNPLPICCLPNYKHYSILRPFVECFTPIRVKEPVFALGNDTYGAYASPYLEAVYGCENRKRNGPPKRPLCPGVPYPPSAPPSPAIADVHSSDAEGAGQTILSE